MQFVLLGFFFSLKLARVRKRAVIASPWVGFKVEFREAGYRDRLCLWYGVAEAQGSQFTLGWCGGNTEQHVLPGGVL